MPLPVRRKARKMEKVKNFCRTATAQHVIPERKHHAVESRMSDGFKISRECRHRRLRRRFGYDRRRIVDRRDAFGVSLGSSIEKPRDGEPARRCNQNSCDDVDNVVPSIGRCGDHQQEFRPSANQRTPFSGTLTGRIGRPCRICKESVKGIHRCSQQSYPTCSCQLRNAKKIHLF